MSTRVAPRWEGDERGDGVADATSFAADAGELLAAMRRPNWVAEQPELHLLPHLQRAVSALPFEIVEASTSEDGAYHVQLRWTGNEPGIGEVRAAVFSAIGSFAEASSYVRQRRGGPDEHAFLVFDVVTGILDGRFAPHGHTLRIHVSTT
jgi:hypothetical protein